MPHFMRPIDRVHAERQLIEAFKEQMGGDDIGLFFKRMRIAQPEIGDSYSISDLVRRYEVLLDIAHNWVSISLPRRTATAR